MAQQRSVPPRLSVPRPQSFQPQLSISKTARVYPTFTPTPSKNSALFSPLSTPTPSKRSRAPEGPLWLFTVLQLLSFYVLHWWLSGLSSSPPHAIFAFSSILVAAFWLNIIYRPWKGRRILSSQWGLLFVSGTLLAFSYFLRFQGLLLAGPLETIFADFAGFLATKILLDSSNKSSETIRKARGLVALLLGVFLLSHGWARVSCSPLAVDVSYRTRIKLINQPEDCLKIWSIFAPFLGGILSACQRMMGARSALKSLGKKRIQVLSYAMGSLALFPVALMQLTVRSVQSPLQFGASFWTVAGVVAFGMIIAFFNEFYTEEKLFLPVYSLRAFQILACCICGLELLYGLDISLVGFVFCSLVFGIGVQELSLMQGQLSWDELGDSSNGSFAFAAWIRRPLQHIFSDTKSRKIAIFLLINAGFMVVEFLYGFLRNSLGLISDACHMLFDCAALAIGLYASYISRLPENSKFNYGYGRFEVVSGYANAVLLVLVASLIVLESIERILEPPEISTESLLVVSVGGLLVNVVGLIFFHEEHHHAHAHGGHSCSHSHSSHISSSSSEATSKDCQVVLSTITSEGSCQLPSNNEYHSMAQNNGHMHSSNVNKQGLNSVHLTQLKDQNLSQSHHLDGDCHFSPGHDPHTLHPHSSQHNRQALSLEHECGSKHDHSASHHHHHDDNDGEDTPVHSHACSSGHSFHPSEGHECASHTHHHNHDSSGVCCDHSNGHDHNGIQHDDGHQGHFHDHSYGNHHIHDGGIDHVHGYGHNDQHHDQSHTHHNAHHDHGHGHHHHMDHNMYGIFLHVLADTLGSVGVVISTLLIKYKGWLITDPACSIFLSVLIIGSVIPLLRNSAEILLQRVPRHNERSLKEAIKKVGGLNGVQSLGRVHLWSFTNTQTVGSLHVQLAAGSDRLLVQEKSLRILREAGILDLTLQIEDVS
ncbi:hypothetical protein GOP47_0020379 [Adiantum capillus-veneris]|uniref:Cation efflux protein transmembrane domain-containing protein n=1 Tax=Adiantum capillus-veneris TaxID=13818 RepID=A0A9D4UE80_ADICA|nr:hypothetical protein GOP47_0020379 [Adiantum capillus-veneris]